MKFTCENCQCVWEREDVINVTADLIECPLCDLGQETEEEEEEEEESEEEEEVTEPVTKKLKSQGFVQQKYSPDMIEFVKDKIDHFTNKQIAEMVNKKFNLDTNAVRIGSFLHYNHLKRKKRLAEPDKKDGTRIKYNKEVLDFIRKYYPTTPAKEMIEILNDTFNLNLNLERFKGILKKQHISKNPPKEKLKGWAKYHADKKKKENKNSEDSIENFVANSKITDAFLLRDEIIEKFEKDVPMADLRKMMGNKSSSKESVKEEVKRITRQREEYFDDIDEMDLD